MKQRRGIRRVVIRAGIFLLLGAIVNVAVAWGCALMVNVWEGNSHAQSQKVDDGMFAREAYSFSRAGGIWITDSHQRLDDLADGDRRTFQSDNAAPFWAGFADPPAEIQSAEATTVLRWGDGRGWPMVSMWSEVRRLIITKDNLIEIPVRGGIHTGLPDWVESYGLPTSPRVLPLLPIWPGFAINTLFYATILWLLLAAPFVLRRRRRLKRGLCPACAYPVGASDLCTECGKPVNPRSGKHP